MSQKYKALYNNLGISFRNLLRKFQHLIGREGVHAPEIFKIMIDLSCWTKLSPTKIMLY